MSGQLAQLVRALPLQGRGRRFESYIAHYKLQAMNKPTAWLVLGFESRSDARVCRRQGERREAGLRKISVRKFICGRHPTLPIKPSLQKHFMDNSIPPAPLRLKIADIFLILLITCSAAALVLNRTGRPADYLEISLNGKHVKTVSLMKNGVYPINTGKGTVRLSIRGGRWRLEKHSLCPAGTCWKTGWTKNLPVVCVPLKLSIEPRRAGIDAISR